MNDLALLAIGLGLGLCLALVAVLAASLVWASHKQRESVRALQKYLTHIIEQNTLETGKLRGEVGLALSRMDAERLYSASLSIQRSSRSLGQQVDTLQKALFASQTDQAAPAIDTTPESFSLDDEALDDQRMAAEKTRWQQAAAPPDPLAGLSEEEKMARVQEWFLRRNQNRGVGIYTPASTPPTPGSGAYASLVEEVQAAQPFVPRAAPADFDDSGEGAEVDLTEKGELG